MFFCIDSVLQQGLFTPYLPILFLWIILLWLIFHPLFVYLYYFLSIDTRLIDYWLINSKNIH